MATIEQAQAARRITTAVVELNRALIQAGSLGLFVELQDRRLAGNRNSVYLITLIEIRETVLPKNEQPQERA